MKAIDQAIQDMETETGCAIPKVIQDYVDQVPKLLEALEGFVEHQKWRAMIVGSDGTWMDTLEKAKKAIKEATEVV
jgi:hypothetical protein